MENQRVTVVLSPQYWTARMTAKPYIAALFAALGLLTVNQGVAGSSPASGAINQQVTAVSGPAPSNTLQVVQYSDGTVHQLGGGLVFEELAEVQGEPGVSMDDFALSISPILRAHSDDTGHEACGAIATDGERFGIVLGTSRSHIGCAIPHAITPDGMRSTGITIHSHGTTRSTRITREDRLFLGDFEGATVRRRVGRQIIDQFSPHDFAEPGYLATPNGALFQEGPRSIRTVR